MNLKIMSTIQTTKPSKPEPASNLVDSNPVNKGNILSKHFETQNSHFCAKDMMGLSWVLYDDIENDV
jgi:hypothetical protein